MVAAIFGAVKSTGPEFEINFDASNVDASFEFSGQTIFLTVGDINSEIGALLAGGVTYILISVLVMAAVYFVLGSVIKVGYARFNANLAD